MPQNSAIQRDPPPPRIQHFAGSYAPIFKTPPDELTTLNKAYGGPAAGMYMEAGEALLSLCKDCDLAKANVRNIFSAVHTVVTTGVGAFALLNQQI